MLDARVDTAAKSATVGKLALRAPQLRIDRDGERRWNVAAWQGAASTPVSASASSPPSAAAAER